MVKWLSGAVRQEVRSEEYSMVTLLRTGEEAIAKVRPWALWVRSWPGKFVASNPRAWTSELVMRGVMSKDVWLLLASCWEAAQSG